MSLVRQAFKPEFLNRLDDIVIFSALSTDDLAQIVELYIDRLSRRLQGRHLDLAVTPNARAWLADRGYDPMYGARPLRRLMQEQIDNSLATALLRGDIQDGDLVMVDLDTESDSLSIRKGD
jgi:ATP-dependent Clp protease ATP-binding subunit ClpB